MSTSAVSREDEVKGLSSPQPSAGAGWLGNLAIFQHLLRRRLAEERLSQQAAALTYHTLFSLLPTLVLALVVMSMVLSTGQVQHDEAIILQKLGLGQLATRQGGAHDTGLFLQTMTAQIQKMRSVLQSPGTGLVGFAVLLWGAISLMNVIEAAFNRIYGVTRKRPWARRLTLYWCVLTLGPLGVASSLLFSGKLMTMVGQVAAAGPILKLSTFALAVAIDLVLLALFYKLIPNTIVRWSSAWLGALAATVLWEAGKYGFGLYVHYLAGYGKWYGNLGLIPLFIFWVFLTWTFVLLGLQIAFIHQHYGPLKRRHILHHGQNAEWVDARWILPLSVLLVWRFETGTTLDAAAAANELGLSAEVTESMLAALAASGLAHGLGGPPTQYVLARAPNQITTAELLHAAGQRCHLLGHPLHAAAKNDPFPTSRLLSEFQALEQQWAASHTLAALAGRG